MFYNSIIEAISNTPVVRLNRVARMWVPTMTMVGRRWIWRCLRMMPKPPRCCVSTVADAMKDADRLTGGRPPPNILQPPGPARAVFHSPPPVRRKKTKKRAFAA